MYFSAVGGSFLKAQALNRYERTRCELYMGEIARRRVQAMTGIHKSYRDAQDSLRSIRAHSGYCGEMHRTGALQVLGGKKAMTDRRQKRVADGTSEATPMVRQAELHKSLDSGESVEPRTLNLSALTALNSAAAAREGTRERIYDVKEGTPKAETLPRDDAPATRNLSSGMKGAETPNTDAKKTSSHVTEMRSDIRRSPTPATERQTAPTAAAAKETSTHERPGKTSSLQHRKPPNAPGNLALHPSSGKDEAKRVRGRTAPENAPRLQFQVASASRSQGAERSSRGKHLPGGDMKNLKVHVSLSRSERQRILQELILNSSVPFDRSALEKERQRLLRDRISRYFELLFEQSDESNEDNAVYDE